MQPPLQAVDLSSKFIQDKALDVVALVCDRMANMQEYDQVCVARVPLRLLNTVTMHVKFLAACVYL